MISFVSRVVAIALATILLSNISFGWFRPDNAAAIDLTQQLQSQSSAASTTQPVALARGVTKTVLDNGLTVLTKEINTAPVVSVQVWYRVGSRNEKPGITGISHQLEHLLFKGTKDRPIQFGRLFSALGSSSNAFTSYDMTAYFGTVGSEKLNALLELEADRMVNTVAGAAELKSENTVVLSELDGGNNNPGTRLNRVVMQAAFPNSSYGWPVIGYRSDVVDFSAEEVQAYYRTHYRPDNAVLVVVGNFNTNAVLKQIKDIFGNITPPPAPSSIPISAPSIPPAKPYKQGEPIVLKEPGSVPFLQSVYPTLPPITHPDVPVLDVMDSVLTSGKSSRLYQALVQTGLASSVGGSSVTLIDPGWYSFSATPAQGKSLKEIDRLILAEVNKLQTNGITPAELERAKAQLLATFILGNRDISSLAQQIGYNQIVANDYAFSDRYLDAVSKVTTADVQRVAKQYLNPEKRVLGFFEPSVVTAQAGNTTAGTTHKEMFAPGKPLDPAEVARYLPKSALDAKAATPKPVKPERFTLANGLRVLLLSDKSSPAIALVGEIKAGTGFDSEAKAGLADLTAQNLMNGTKTQDALAIAKNLENRGASLGFSASRERVSVAGSALSKDLPVVIEQLADVLQNATFPANELELSRQRNLVALKAELDSPGSLARRKFQQKVFPQGHPFHAMRTEATLQSITREEIASFYKTHYRPDTTTLTIFGDFDPATTKTLLTQALSTWQAKGTAPQLQYPDVKKPATIQQEQVVLPGKTQAIAMMGHLGIARRDPRYYKALVLNQVLGGDTLASRLGTEIRDRLGLTYGIFSAFQAGQGAGPFVIQMQTSAKDNQKAIDATLALLRQLREKGVSQAELDAAKRSLINSFPVELADPDNIANAILSDEVYGFEIGNFYQFPSKVKEIDLDAVNKTARELIFPENLAIVTVTPGDKS
ncbi:M16 family metallopeptidase [Pseudanabaena sp. PCC 6802]|uniref:M16 family metallopeptidase n=1 Tax=Pseudanabaena sp. PCC 6802 TaxID=118173 RepID=UPI0003467046|nr:pitrilysin family protein [Pseudanabaena sp. PCC 6802]